MNNIWKETSPSKDPQTFYIFIGIKIIMVLFLIKVLNLVESGWTTWFNDPKVSAVRLLVRFLKHTTLFLVHNEKFTIQG